MSGDAAASTNEAPQPVPQSEGKVGVWGWTKAIGVAVLVVGGLILSFTHENIPIVARYFSSPDREYKEAYQECARENLPSTPAEVRAGYGAQDMADEYLTRQIGEATANQRCHPVARAWVEQVYGPGVVTEYDSP